jgi:hypothetical protein
MTNSRERNMILARKMRIRKKEELEGLREEIAALKSENDTLRRALSLRDGSLPPPVQAASADPRQNQCQSNASTSTPALASIPVSGMIGAVA